jgi:hypothetical protein
MEIGGSRLNAAQLAGAVRDCGHEVIVIFQPGPLVERVRCMGLEHVQIPLARRRPSLKILRMLVRLVRELTCTSFTATTGHPLSSSAPHYGSAPQS